MLDWMWNLIKKWLTIQPKKPQWLIKSKFLQLHNDLGEDIPKLQKQVQHLLKTFEIQDPVEVAVSI